MPSLPADEPAVHISRGLAEKHKPELFERACEFFDGASGALHEDWASAIRRFIRDVYMQDVTRTSSQLAEAVFGDTWIVHAQRNGAIDYLAADHHPGELVPDVACFEVLDSEASGRYKTYHVRADVVNDSALFAADKVSSHYSLQGDRYKRFAKTHAVLISAIPE